MKVMKTSEIPAQVRGGGLFQGRVAVQTVLDSPDSELRTNLINFDEGAVNVFHTHTFDQVLYVTEGEGIIANDHEEIRITAGTFVVIPAGERHWHGAVPGSKFSHIAIAIRGKTTY
jgi:quercetin dioxygenase-like cupin family protein